MRKRRSQGSLSILAVMLDGFPGIPVMAAQEGSPVAGGPPPGPFEIAPGVTVEGIAWMEGNEIPLVYDMTIAPGTVYGFEALPALDMAYVGSGTLTAQLDVPTVVGQANAPDQGLEPVEANATFTVETGHYVVVPPFTAGELRNEGDVPVVITIAGHVPTDLATPEASPVC
jgi:hypothetical protein